MARADRVPLADSQAHPASTFAGRIPIDSTARPLSPAFQPPPTALQKISQAAGIIFSGHVTFVSRGSLNSGPLNPGPVSASTAITFQVDQGIRGVSTGQELTIHEWAGLWASGERYRIGDSVFLFLYPPSKLGLTSPVAGAMGRFALDPAGRILINGQSLGPLTKNQVALGKPTVSFAEFIRAAGLSGRRE